MSVRVDRVPPSLARGHAPPRPPAPRDLPPRRAPVARRKVPPFERFLSLVVFGAIMMGLLAVAIGTVTAWDPVVEYSSSSAIVEDGGRELLVTAQVARAGPSTDRTADARLVATDLDSGARAWVADPDGRNLPLTVLAADRGYVYAASGDGPVVVDAASGEIIPIDHPLGTDAVPARDVTGSAHDREGDRLLVLATDGAVWQVPIGRHSAEPTDDATASAWSDTLGRALAGAPVPSGGLSTDAQGRLVATVGCHTLTTDADADADADADGSDPTPPGAAPPDDRPGVDHPVDCVGASTIVGADDGIELRPTSDSTSPGVDIARTEDGTVTRITVPGRIVAAFDSRHGPGLVLDSGIALVIEVASGSVREVPLA